MTYEEAIAKASHPLARKIETSVALLRKAEPLAKKYDPENGFFLAFSGGKDSQALYHVAELANVQFKAHFSPTTVDPPQVIRFIRERYPDVEFTKVKASMYEVAKKKHIVPTMRLRWCCAEFKEHAGAGRVTLTGIRRAESIKRSKRNAVEVSSHKFSGDLDAFQKWSEEQIQSHYKNLNQDEFSRDKTHELRCINGKDSIIVNPIMDWQGKDVWEFLNSVVEVPHCILYDAPYNHARIGCILCPMSSYKSKLKDCELFPHVKRKWVEVIQYLIDKGYLSERQKMISRSGVSKEEMAEILFQWWISGKNWDKFIADYTHPKLF